ncbi:uncharacterized protein LOC132612707 [Lycium barbarum]|uniref:uncharacterized protein LOC132612707 n=1 Tax=Lycium barbarum TaxID=112863 RepID=UPI00293F62FF|nr:uncharacterized protein LOC132612707 [Lycium barbarum]
MHSAGANCNGKIWFFVNDNVDVQVVSDTEHEITLKLFLQEHNRHMISTLVYAKCDDLERLQLWDSIYHLSTSIDIPWMVGGDFNVVLNEEEKIGGTPIVPQDYEDFAFRINSCELEETSFKGSPFTWWNGRARNDYIFERLDRMVVNSHMQNWIGNIEVEHLSRTGSNHALLFITLGTDIPNFIKPFRFRKFWTDHKDFQNIVKDNWPEDSEGDPFLNFKKKIKQVKGALSAWSKVAFGNIFKQLIREEIVRVKEQFFEEDPSRENRCILQLAQAEMKKHIHFVEEFWKQKSGYTWFSEGDRNIKFFHSIANGKRKRLQVKRIQDADGVWLENEEGIAQGAVLVTDEYNDMLCALSTEDEVKKAAFDLKGESACGPDGLSGSFYQACWNIVGIDVYKVVKAFYEGHTLPNSVTHTNLVLLPEKEVVQQFTDLRPMSLSNFVNKVISKVVHGRLDKILHEMISPNQ